MKTLFGSSLLFAMLLGFSSVPPAVAEERDSRYEMRGAYTYVAPYDAEYGVSRIELKRTPRTNALHWIDFTINRVERVCTYWIERCVAYDNQGRCVRYEYVCGSWYDRTEPVDKRIQIDFRRAGALSGDQMETYELQIDRFRPNQNGEDDVRTWLRDREVVQPVRVRRNGDWDYRVEVK